MEKFFKAIEDNINLETITIHTPDRKYFIDFYAE